MSPASHATGTTPGLALVEPEAVLAELEIFFYWPSEPCGADQPGLGQDPPSAARTIAALLALRDHVIEPILAGVRSPRPGRKPAHWTRIDADYQALRTGMQALFDDLGISMLPAAG